MTACNIEGSGKPKAVLWAGIARAQIADRLRSLPQIDLVEVDDLSGFSRAIDRADILAMPSRFYTADVAQRLSGSPGSLRFLQLLTAGFEQLDQYGVPTDLRVANAGTAIAPAVAEHVLALLLALVRGLPALQKAQAACSWEKDGAERLRSLLGATVAIIGFGAIGQQVALRLRGFGAHVVAVSRATHDNPLANEIVLLDRLDDILPRADAVILSLPYRPEHHHLIDARRLALCRPGMFIVNVARGPLVDTAAIVAALEEHKIGGFATDVTETEPLPVDSPLWVAPNTIVTPHVAGADGEMGYNRLADFAARNIALFVSGKTPENIVRINPGTAPIAPLALALTEPR